MYLQFVLDCSKSVYYVFGYKNNWRSTAKKFHINQLWMLDTYGLDLTDYKFVQNNQGKGYNLKQYVVSWENNRYICGTIIQELSSLI